MFPVQKADRRLLVKQIHVKLKHLQEPQTPQVVLARVPIECNF
ncbi:hypothetical protein CLV98_104305 [Dyadobacter jejuensis]|uniref:Uncharacterized protein n=1 Tax=Dyadobacter jejuensis TaxID=1082580 RepID=A0A316AKW9_9BACT|nr:hypothetical protein CLV98_104305 [Dyadobacter jejuensis]